MAFYFSLKIMFTEKRRESSHQVEIRFSEFVGRNAPSWYPALVEVFWEKELRASFRVKRATPLKTISSDLFDLKKVRSQYPASPRQKKFSISSTTRVGEMLEAVKSKL